MLRVLRNLEFPSAKFGLAQEWIPGLVGHTSMHLVGFPPCLESGGQRLVEVWAMIGEYIANRLKDSNVFQVYV